MKDWAHQRLSKCSECLEHYEYQRIMRIISDMSRDPINEMCGKCDIKKHQFEIDPSDSEFGQSMKVFENFKENINKPAIKDLKETI